MFLSAVFFLAASLISGFEADAKTIMSNELPGAKCVVGGGILGRCEELNSCLSDGGIIRSSGQVSLCQSQGEDFYVCCRKPHEVAKELCDAWSTYWRNEAGECEIEHPLIIGGSTANLGEFPHMALVGRAYRTSKVNYNCGGTLVSPYFVVTAAHCLLNHVDGMTYWVKLGEHDLEHDSSTKQIPIRQGPVPSSLYGSGDLAKHLPEGTAPVEQVIQAIDVQMHPSYDVAANYHDIAILKLVTPAKFTKRVLPACLPYHFPAEDFLGQKLTVTGWGITSGIRQMSRTLQKVEVPVVDRLECSTTRANTRKTPLGITEDMLCAGELGKDSCGGDSGGPLTTQKPRNNGSSCEHTLVGVVSFGIGVNYNSCGALGIYARVTSYLDWITGIIAPNIPGESL